MSNPVISNTYVGDGTTVLYSFTFPYINVADVVVSIDGTVQSSTTEYSFANATTIQFTTAPATSAAILIKRVTSAEDVAAVFFPGSAVRARDLNDNFVQGLYVSQESTATAAASSVEAQAASANAALAATAATSSASDAATTLIQANAAAASAATAQAASATAQTQANNASAAAAAAAADATAAQASSATAIATANASSAASTQAVSDSAAAVVTSNNAAALVATANTNSNAAVVTANQSATDAASAVNISSSAQSLATQAQSDASAAQVAASAAQTASANAVTVANQSASDAATAVSDSAAAVVTSNAANATAATSNTNSTQALNTANTSLANSASALTASATATTDSAAAVVTANNASATATSAANAVSSAVFYSPIGNFAAFPANPSNTDRIEVSDSTGLESQSIITGIPSGFTGASDLTMRLEYNSSTSKWEFKQYFAEDPEARYIPKPGGTFTGPVNFEDDLIVKGDSTNGSGELTLNCENNSHGIKIKGPPHSAGANYTLTLPNDTGTNGQALITNGSGVSSWSTIDLASRLPLAGGTMTGNITFTGSQTFDGRDLSADGSKLDGIETGATADQTKADIDALNINADTLDGQHGSYYTGYTDTAVSNLVDSSPATLNTLNELAAALGDDPNFATTTANSIGTKLPLAGGTLTGALTGTSATFTGNVTLQANLDMQDNDKILLGTGDDLEIYHDGSNSYVKNNTGVLRIHGTEVQIRDEDSNESLAKFIPQAAVELYYDNSKKFVTKTDGIDVTGEVQCDSLDVDGAADITGNVTLHANLDLQDSDKILLGTGDDLQIYHNGSHSYIDDAGTGNLYIRGSSTVELGKYTGETFVKGTADGDVRVYYDNSVKLVTKSDGVDITGELQCDSLDVDGTGQYSGGQRGAVSTHNSISGTFTMDLNTSNNFKITFIGNTTINNPSNQTAGQHGVVALVQDGTGGRTLSFGSNWKFPGGTAPTNSTGSNAQDLLAYYVAASGTIYAQLIVDLK